ncbi:MAG: homoserine dehydrogenase [Alphaproteobacteria bacterium]
MAQISAKPPLRLGIIGLGTVGCGVLHMLRQRQSAMAQAAGRAVQVVAVSARERYKTRAESISTYAWFDDPLALVNNPEVDVVIELAGGAHGMALQVAEATLNLGKPLITANKAMLATQLLPLLQRAKQHGASVHFEAAVAGGIPIIKTIQQAMVGSRITQISAILNGTTNYMLTRMMQDNMGYAEALTAAQQQGYAEADPHLDVSGQDAAQKLAILAYLAFGDMPDVATMPCQGITHLKLTDMQAAATANTCYKLLATATLTPQGVVAQVQPAALPASHLFAQVHGADNAILLEAEGMPRLFLAGPGAGSLPTANAVLADIADVARLPR